MGEFVPSTRAQRRRLRWRAALAGIAGLALAITPAIGASAAPSASPGAPGIGDPYYPLSGNGGYNVLHYGLDIDYVPDTDVLTGHAVITATATQNLSTFNLDLHGLSVRNISVNGRAATWSRSKDELVVTPRTPLRKGLPFVTIVSYSGVPELYEDAALGTAGFFHTDDGTLVAGQPWVAASWFPSNDHPADKALYTIRITVPKGLEAISNGSLLWHGDVGGKANWVWNVDKPMASYLATATIGQFDLTRYSRDGISYLDALDPDLFDPTLTARTGTDFAYSQQANDSYKRLERRLTPTAGSSALTFWMDRSVEPGWDFAFVEAAPAGTDDWTTLADENGHTGQDAGNAMCSDLLDQHPFLAHYLQEPPHAGPCDPSGTTGDWNAATGEGEGWEQWRIDLSAYAGEPVDVAITYVSDYAVQLDGVAIDDVRAPGGVGSTSFEPDADPLDGWSVTGAPAGSPGNANDWIATSDGPAPIGVQAKASLAREPEVISFLSGIFGPYPFRQAGGIVDDFSGLGFALENQTRPIYAKEFFGGSKEQADGVVVHELAHQWYGDDVALKRWSDIWLNEGFATYAEWLWAEHEGYADPQAYFDAYYATPADDDLWTLPIGDPGPDDIFDGAVYDRGGMTLHALRLTVGDDAFFTILRRWAAEHSGGHGTTAGFIALAEQVSGQDLGDFFDDWLFSDTKPPAPPSGARTFVAPEHPAKLVVPTGRR
ncbi:M1 family aminopeptidase [Rathayibacter sp. YIM 133350]|uniref:M1 family aminopeptidase n=1 Tax=Rathayibacter sp. YIM 133350 TaxID=3131992 RepID=UPI00307F7BE5